MSDTVPEGTTPDFALGSPPAEREWMPLLFSCAYDMPNLTVLDIEVLSYRLHHSTAKLSCASAVAANRAHLAEQVRGLHDEFCVCPADGSDPDCYRPEAAAVLALLSAPAPSGGLVDD